MIKSFHHLRDLFEQLGLAANCQSISRFIRLHAPLDSHVLLSEASFWTSSQQDFLKEELLNDADWAESIDLLDSQLRKIH